MWVVNGMGLGGEWAVYVYEAVVVRVVDGDTVRLSVDLGFRLSLVENFRLVGIDAPEMSTQAGLEARDYLAGLLPVGSLVAIRSEKGLRQEKYGRWMASVWTREEDGAWGVSDRLVAAGHAVAWDGRGKRPGGAIGGGG